MKKSSWKARSLMIDAEEELKMLGQNLRIARERRKFAVTDLAKRLDVDRRVIDKLENGDPTVSLGALMQVLNLFGMVKGISQFAAPEHDIEEIILEARKFRNAIKTKKGKTFSKEELDF